MVDDPVIEETLIERGKHGAGKMFPIRSFHTWIARVVFYLGALWLGPLALLFQVHMPISSDTPGIRSFELRYLLLICYPFFTSFNVSTSSIQVRSPASQPTWKTRFNFQCSPHHQTVRTYTKAKANVTP